jgi:predicted ArsR family transcriptional regulator
MQRPTDIELLTGIREATSAWQAPQTTAYYAERWHVKPMAMRRWLLRLERAGLVERYGVRDWTWTAKD